MLQQAGFYPLPVPSGNFVRACRGLAANSIASPCRLYSTSRVRRLPARPHRASPVLLVGLVPSRRHPWDFSLQRSDHVLSRTPFGWPCPSFPWQVASSRRHPDALRPHSDRLDDLPVFTPVAPGCRGSRDGRLAWQSSFEDRLAQRHLTGAASLAAGRTGLPRPMLRNPKDSVSMPTTTGQCRLGPS